MRWYMPCKLGEFYPETRFLEWTNNTRVFGKTGRMLQMIEAECGMDGSFCSEPEVFRGYVARTKDGSTVLESYSVGKWNFERFILEIPDALFKEQLQKRKKSRLIGIKYDENGLLGHYITCDRYEHFYEPINIELVYTEFKDRQYIHFDFKEDTCDGRKH